MTETNNHEQDALLAEVEHLRRFLNTLSYSGMGVDKSLDQALRALRSNLKNNDDIEQIKISVDDVTKALRELEETVETAQKTTPASLTPFEPLLLEFAKFANSKESKRLKQLAGQLSGITIDQFITELSPLLKSVIEAQTTKSSSNEKKSWWPFSNKNKTVEPKSQIDSSEVSINSSIPDSLLMTLHNFIEQLATVEIYHHASKSLKEQIAGLVDLDHLSKFIESTAMALLEAANQEHVQFENFLQKLNKRLLSVASFLTTAAKNNDDVMQDTNVLEESIQKTIEDIKNEIEETQGLGDLKQKLLASFSHIFTSMGHFKTSQSQRVKVTQSELELVKEQLKVTEEESQRLRDNLKEQRFRAYNDPLTQLPNRYAYNERLTQEYSRWRRYRSPLSLVVADIDYFKKINDQYGHSGGDNILVSVSEILSQGLRESDFIARFGGEEFVILMPETSLNDATKAINKLRVTISKMFFSPATDQKISVTVSFGVSEFEGTDTPSAVFAKADKALYRAKNKGRNQVCAERNGQFE